MPFYRMWPAATVIALLLAIGGLTAPASAEAIIQKVANKSLTGAAYARLRNLTYDQCQARCLSDTRCVALEHYRGGGLIRRSSNCALFSSVQRTTDSQTSDVGYKRQQTAAGDSRTVRRYARPPAGGAASAPVIERAQPPPPAPVRESATRSIAPRVQPQVAPRAAEAPSAPTATRSARPAVLPAPRPAELQPDAAAAPATERRATAAADDARYHIVPIFYGTDRNQVKQQGRIAYANDRAKRLEIGRALISVPLDHKVPNIERPRAWSIPYIGTIQLEREDPNHHFTVREVKVLSKADLLNLVKQRLADSRTFRNQSVVFIHGYNTSFDEALFRTAQISYDLQFDGASFAYSWPSGGGLSSYIYDRDSAQGAERYLYEFLQMVQNETGSTSINIIAHSMGNQMLLQVLRSLKLRAPDAIARINQIILASPDVDRDAFEAMAAEITGVAKGITLYASARDRALEASRFVAGNKPRAGDVPEGGPVIVTGIDTIDITQVSTDYLALHHSGYAEHSDLLTDIGQIIRAGTRPWERRLKAYKPVKLQAGIYWRYEK